MKPVEKTAACYPVDVAINHATLVQSSEQLCEKLLGETWRDRISAHKHFTINLNHPPGIVGVNRFFTLNGNHNDVIKAGYDEGDFTVVPDEVSMTYIDCAMRLVKEQHYEKFGTEFRGRAQLIWVNRAGCYSIHRDDHTPHRYHVPLWTNPSVFWLFRDNEADFNLLHMPADGRVWYLDPIQEAHSVMNLGVTPRCHLLMTSVV